MTLEKMWELLVPLGELYDKEITQTLAGIYHVAFRGYEEAAIRDAMSRHVLRSKWFPKISELRELIEGSTEGRCAEAWHCLVRTMERVGAYQSVQFEDPAIHAVVRTWGGWSSVCQITEEELRYRQGDFRRLYQRAVEQGLDGDGHLPGIVEAENRAKGYLDEVPAPVRVGMRAGELLVGNHERKTLGEDCAGTTTRPRDLQEVRCEDPLDQDPGRKVDAVRSDRQDHCDERRSHRDRARESLRLLPSCG